jgi:hypothetical protein
MNKQLEQTIELAKLKGYVVFTFENHDRPITHIFIANQAGNVGECSEFYGGIQFSTCHKPMSGVGSGFGNLNGHDFHSPNDIDICFIRAPRWASYADSERVRKYTGGMSEYMKKSTRLTYYEL